MPSMNIRRAVESDFGAMWLIFQKVVSDEATYVFASDTSYEDAFAYWFGPSVTSYVAVDDGQIVGMYKLIPNQRNLGNHVANASFMVSHLSPEAALSVCLRKHPYLSDIG